MYISEIVYIFGAISLGRETTKIWLSRGCKVLIIGLFSTELQARAPTESAMGRLSD